MYIDLEFTVADLRPLEGKEKQLVPYLRPLHVRDETLSRENRADVPYYRFIGSLNTWEKSEKTYFSAPNALKIPVFQQHILSFPVRKVPVTLHRQNHLRRYFSSSMYGSVNNFRFGFGFRLRGYSDSEGRLAHEVLKYIFSLPVKVGARREPGLTNGQEPAIGEKSRKKVPRPTREITLGSLGCWLEQVVERATHIGQTSGLPDWLEKFYRISNPQPRAIGGKVSDVGLTVVWEYEADELESLPRDARTVYDGPEIGLDVYDFRLKKTARVVRVYFVKKKPALRESSSHGSGEREPDIKKLRHFLMRERARWLCLDCFIDRISLNNQQQKDFADRILNAGSQAGESGVDRIPADAIYDPKRSEEIRKRVKMLRRIG